MNTSRVLTEKELCRILEMRLSVAVLELDIFPDLVSVNINEAGTAVVVGWKLSVQRELLTGILVVTDGNKIHYGAEAVQAHDFDGNWDTVSRILCGEVVKSVERRKS